jgi:hypothetical protein
VDFENEYYAAQDLYTIVPELDTGKGYLTILKEETTLPKTASSYWC